jgi:23S rRNA pseudouridine2605 synthase
MPAERLQKVLAAAGIASRRASEALIAEGRVTVDGRPATIGQSVDPGSSVILVDGRPVAPLGPAAAVHLVLHKPAGVTSTVRDPHAARTVLDLVPTALLPEGGRLYPVGRLDRDSDGLLLLTNDGPWAERVLHPRFGVEREYAIGVRGPLTAEQGRTLEAGIVLEEGTARLFHLRPATDPETRRLEELLTPPPRTFTWYRATLRQGWKRQLRRMFAAVGVPIERLVRVRIGPLRLERLRGGQVRPLSAAEVRALNRPLDRLPGRDTAATGTKRVAARPTGVASGASRARTPAHTHRPHRRPG